MKMRTQSFKCCLGLLLLLSGISGLRADTTVGVDPAAAWIGFMNVFNLPADGGAFVFNGGWGTADLNASFSGSVLTLTPNTSISRDVPLTDAFWWKPDGSGNKTMDANMYVQNDALAGQTVNFTGLVLGNSLVSPYLSTIFIKDFSADYSSSTTVSAPASAGAFNLSLATSAGHHIQYGFETIGPNASLTGIGALGQVQVTAVPEPTVIPLMLGGIASLIIRRKFTAAS
jgi:hypothetical protein